MLPRRLYLTCHGLGVPREGLSSEACRFWVPTAVFKRCLDVAARLEAGTGIEIHFTFDDGNATDCTEALPLLRAHRRQAIFFVCAGRIGRPGYLDADQIRQLVAAGMTIGCHGYEHLDWRLASDDKLHHELVDGRRAIEAASGTTVDLASAPFGALDQRVVRAAAAAGFKCLFASSGGFATGGSGLIPRNSLQAGFEPERDLVRMVSTTSRAWAGLYDTARRVKYGFY
jgi:peptidoglycan/xylan/chitin deacetylase (PgdA/CDA1 family)